MFYLFRGKSGSLKRDRAELEKLLSASVAITTKKKYDGLWTRWCSFMLSRPARGYDVAPFSRQPGYKGGQDSTLHGCRSSHHLAPQFQRIPVALFGTNSEDRPSRSEAVIGLVGQKNRADVAEAASATRKSFADIPRAAGPAISFSHHRRFLRVLQIQRHGTFGHSRFCEERLSTSTLTKRLRTELSARVNSYTLHSFRSGGATAAVNAKVPRSLFATDGRWQ